MFRDTKELYEEDKYIMLTKQLLSSFQRRQGIETRFYWVLGYDPELHRGHQPRVLIALTYDHTITAEIVYTEEKQEWSFILNSPAASGSQFSTKDVDAMADFVFIFTKGHHSGVYHTHKIPAIGYLWNKIYECSYPMKKELDT